MNNTDTVFQAASSLSIFEKAKLIDRLIASLDLPDKQLGKLWAKEAEQRIEAYDKGKIKAVSLETVLQKYR